MNRDLHRGLVILTRTVGLAMGIHPLVIDQAVREVMVEIWYPRRKPSPRRGKVAARRKAAGQSVLGKRGARC